MPQPVKGEFANKPSRLYTLLDVYAMGKGIRCMGDILCAFITSAHCGYSLFPTLDYLNPSSGYSTLNR